MHKNTKSPKIHTPVAQKLKSAIRKKNCMRYFTDIMNKIYEFG